MLWRIVRAPLIGALNVLAALLLLFEEWGWRPLSHALARLARFRVWAELELWIAGLPPYGALVALGVPSAVLIPAKFAGVYLLATGHLITAAAVIVAAKITSTALIARVFMLTKPALMQIAWFKRAYDVFVPWHDRVVGWIRNSWAWRYGRIVKWRVAGYMRRSWRTLRPRHRARRGGHSPAGARGLATARRWREGGSCAACRDRSASRIRRPRARPARPSSFPRRRAR